MVENEVSGARPDLSPSEAKSQDRLIHSNAACIELSRLPSVPVQVYGKFAELPASYTDLFDASRRQDFFLTRDWFQNFANTALQPGTSLRIYGISMPDQPNRAAGMFVAASMPQHGVLPLRKLSALTNYYTCFYAPHLSVSGDPVQTLQALAKAWAAERPRWDEIEIRPLDVGSEEFSLLEKALKMAGFAVQKYFCFGNWYLPVQGQSYEEYHERLPSALKNTLRKRRRNLEKTGRGVIEIITGGERLEAAIQAFTKLYEETWKHPEPYPDFVPGLIRTCAEMGALRLGLIFVGGEPAAAQLWMVNHGAALVYKSAYDRRFADLSVGSILRAAVTQHVLDVDKVDEIDYLSGDEAYKRDWVTHRRERWGILAMNPRTPRGAVSIARNLGLHTIKQAALALSGRRNDPSSVEPVPPNNRSVPGQNQRRREVCFQ